MTADMEKGIVPDSVKSVSSNVYVSKSREWLFYNFSEIYSVVQKIDETLREKPKYLLPEELEFLITYKADFGKYRIHNQFKLATTDYISLLNKALDALDSRLNKEEQITIGRSEYHEIKGQLVVAFTQISTLFKDLRNTFFTNLEMIQQEPKRYMKVIKFLLNSVNYLLKAYVYEYAFFKNPKEVSFEELVDFNSEVDKTYIEFNHSEFATPIYKLENQIYETYA